MEFIPEPIFIQHFLASTPKIVRPKIGNRKKHPGKYGKYPKKLGKQ